MVFKAFFISNLQASKFIKVIQNQSWSIRIVRSALPLKTTTDLGDISTNFYIFFMLFFLFAYIFKQHIHTILFQFSWSKDDKFVIYYNIFYNHQTAS